MVSRNQVPGQMYIERLIGRENYHTWSIAMEAVLQHEELWDTIKAPENGTLCQDPKKVAKARAKLILYIDPLLYVHVQDMKTAKEAWDKLELAFKDTGLMRKISLLWDLTTTKLENCASIDEYVNIIITTAHKLNRINMEVNDEWIGALLLAGLPSSYKPMIMAIESSGIKITADAIKTKLLQEIKWGDNTGESREASYFSSSSRSRSNKHNNFRKLHKN